MKKRNSFLALLFVLAIIIGLLPGCSGNQDTSSKPAPSSTPSTDSTSSNKPSSESSSSSTDAPALIGNGNTYATGLPIVKEKETLTIAVSRHTLDKSNSFNEKPAFIQAEKETNIHIEWIELQSGTERERVSIMLAAEMPDIFLGLLNEADIAKNKASFVPLYDLVQEYAPNIVATYEKIENGWDMVRMPDGNVYSLMTFYESLLENQANGVQFINQKWLDKVGKSIPTNIDEFYDVLVAFKNEDPNGNGKADEIPLEFCDNNWAAGHMNFAGPWGFTGYYRIENGTVIPTISSNEYRAFLEFYHKLAKEGLVDIEGFSQTNQQFYAKLKEYVCGSYFGWTPQSNFNSETAKEYVLLPPMAVPGMEGKQVTSGQLNKITANRTAFVITTECDNPIAAIRWWDYLSSSTEMKLTVALGEEGKLWEKDGKGGYRFVYPDTVTDDFTRENMKYTWGLVNYMPIVTLDETPYNDGNIYPEAAIRDGFVSAVKDYFPKEVLPVRFVDETKTQERAFIETDLNEYIKSFTANSIINGVTDASWEEHLKQLKALNYDQWIQWYQDFLDGKF